jgi:hypothetical protein
MDVQPHCLLHQVRWHLLRPTTAASLEVLQQIQQLGHPQQQSTPPPAESAASSCRARDIQCHRCKGFRHVMQDCPSKRVLVVRDDGEYSSASDFDEDTLSLLAVDHVGSDDHHEEHIGTDDADHYESLIVQRVLSTQMESGAKSSIHIVSNKVSSKNGRVA